MGPGSKYAFLVHSDEDCPKIIRVHQRVPITLQGRSLRIEHTENLVPWVLVPSGSWETV
jgi:hypothetical protein